MLLLLSSLCTVGLILRNSVITPIESDSVKGLVGKCLDVIRRTEKSRVMQKSTH